MFRSHIARSNELRLVDEEDDFGRFHLTEKLILAVVIRITTSSFAWPLETRLDPKYLKSGSFSTGNELIKLGFLCGQQKGLHICDAML
ncbi:unnamed protein product [Dracunculus medinensis]|uniref:Uncharacterized protein n=1 Tax=Dracunculus medinensis TaxID=318479 RepID=A0A0N4UEY9_DRAME|nr:unnamed protein product [Dracunculus medinensis]